MSVNNTAMSKAELATALSLLAGTHRSDALVAMRAHASTPSFMSGRMTSKGFP